MSTGRKISVGGSSSSGVPAHAFMLWQLHFDGTNGSTTITDVGGRGWTCAGNAQITTTGPVFGTGCLTLDGTGDYVWTADCPDLAFGVVPFTLDWRAKKTSSSAAYYVLSQREGSGSNFRGMLLLMDANGVHFATYNSSTAVSVLANCTQDTSWHAYRLVYTGVKAFIFQDGVLKNSGASGPIGDASGATVYIGVGPDGTTTPFNGQIDEMRLLKGVALTRTDYTVDTAAFSDTFA